MIPRGLPGEGNILIYDNGGWAGYYAPNPGSPTGIRGALRDYSRVLSDRHAGNRVADAERSRIPDAAWRQPFL